MASISWPATLPKYPQKGFSETSGVIVARTSMDKGPAKQRRLGNAVNTFSVTYFMDRFQIDTFETFVKSTLKGVLRFTIPHPRNPFPNPAAITGKYVETSVVDLNLEVRIVPQNNGELYTLNYLGPGYYNVSLTLEALP